MSSSPKPKTSRVGLLMADGKHHVHLVYRHPSAKHLVMHKTKFLDEEGNSYSGTGKDSGWEVTHVPTGRRASVFRLRNRAEAERYATLVSSLLDKPDLSFPLGKDEQEAALAAWGRVVSGSKVT